MDWFCKLLKATMSRSKNFFQNLIKPFKLGSSRGNEQNPVLIFAYALRFAMFLTMIWFMFLLCFDWSEGQNEEDLEKIAQQEQKQFPFETLVAATKDFHQTHKLGEGGFGPVYKVSSRSVCNFDFPEDLKSVWFLRKLKGKKLIYNSCWACLASYYLFIFYFLFLHIYNFYHGNTGIKGNVIHIVKCSKDVSSFWFWHWYMFHYWN